MTEIKNNILLNSVFCLIFAGFARLIYNLIDSEMRLIELSMSIFLMCFCILCSLYNFNNVFNFKLLNKFLEISYIPFITIFFLQELFAFSLPVIVFLMSYFLPTLLFNTINEYNSIKPFNYDGILYLINVVTVLLYAYFGDNLMKVLFILFKVKFFKNIILDMIITKKNIRIYTYIIMIIIYIVYNFYTFNDIKSIWGYSVDSFNVVKEVFVTFVAIDTLIQIFKTNQNKYLKDNDSDLEKSFKERYKSFKEKIKKIFSLNDYKS